jgi:hypothetical protein
VVFPLAFYFDFFVRQRRARAASRNRLPLARLAAPFLPVGAEAAYEAISYPVAGSRSGQRR